MISGACDEPMATIHLALEEEEKVIQIVTLEGNSNSQKSQHISYGKLQSVTVNLLFENLQTST